MQRCKTKAGETKARGAGTFATVGTDRLLAKHLPVQRVRLGGVHLIGSARVHVRGRLWLGYGRLAAEPMLPLA